VELNSEVIAEKADTFVANPDAVLINKIEFIMGMLLQSGAVTCICEQLLPYEEIFDGAPQKKGRVTKKGLSKTINKMQIEISVAAGEKIAIKEEIVTVTTEDQLTTVAQEAGKVLKQMGLRSVKLHDIVLARKIEILEKIELHGSKTADDIAWLEIVWSATSQPVKEYEWSAFCTICVVVNLRCGTVFATAHALPLELILMLNRLRPNACCGSASHKASRHAASAAAYITCTELSGRCAQSDACADLSSGRPSTA